MNNHHTPPPSVTSIPPSPDINRAHRMRTYTIAMSIRTGCVLACLVTPWPYLLLPALGAIFLPYIAVVVANTPNTMPGEVLNPHTRHLDR